ncbi:MAG: hypothetical protein NZZ41_07795 [Candidatus Dojkabacteria bacterium]|nr:hypothetical protein [Candidatus Dojkabacteria bacterium]
MLSVKPEDFLGDIYHFMIEMKELNKKLIYNLTSLKKLFEEANLTDYETSDEKGIMFSYPVYRSFYYKTGDIKHKNAPKEGLIEFCFYFKKNKNVPKTYFSVNFKFRHQLIFYVGFEFDYGVYSRKEIEYELVLSSYKSFLQNCVKSIYNTLNSFKDYYYTIKLPYETSKFINIDNNEMQCLTKSKKDILVTLR